MSKCAFALLLAYLFQAVVAEAEPPRTEARRVASIDDEDDAEADDDADDAEADDDAADDDPPPTKPSKPKKRRLAGDDEAPPADDESTTDEGAAADDEAAADDDELPPGFDAKPKAKKKASKTTGPKKSSKKKSSKRARKKPAAEESVETGPKIIDEQYVVPPTVTFAAEVLGAAPVDSVNGDLFAAGGGVGIGGEYYLSPALGLHASASYLYLRAGGGMSTTSWMSGQIGPRLHVGAKLFGASTHHDAWVDAHVNYGSSGGIRRPGFDVGLAVQWEVSPGARLGPVVRYAFGSDPLDKHAQVATVGLALGVGGRTRTTIHIEGDADGDGLIDRLDACPTELPGDVPDPDQPGCPVRDADGDGVADEVDECAEESAGETPDPEHAGCPVRDPDTDGDSIKDSVDKCPNLPGPKRTDPATNGCPLARVQDRRIEILDQIFFETDSATITDSSQPVMEAIGSVIAELGEAKISIEGHTDEVGTDGHNLRLSKRRARAVAQWLIENAGIAPGRLQTEGYGKTRPLVSGPGADTSKNRRVEFVILEDK